MSGAFLQLGVISSLIEAIKSFVTFDLVAHVAYFCVCISSQQVQRFRCHKHVL
jgi:hypothetical protein